MPNITITLSDDTHARLEALVRYTNWDEAWENGPEGRFLTPESSLAKIATEVVTEAYDEAVKDTSDEYKSRVSALEEMYVEQHDASDYETRSDYDHDITNAEKKLAALEALMSQLRLPAPVGPEAPL